MHSQPVAQLVSAAATVTCLPPETETVIVDPAGTGPGTVMTMPGASSTEVALIRRDPGLAARASATCRSAAATERWLGVAAGMGLPPAAAGATPLRAVAKAAIASRVTSRRTRRVRTRESAMRAPPVNPTVAPVMARVDGRIMLAARPGAEQAMHRQLPGNLRHSDRDRRAPETLVSR